MKPFNTITFAKVLNHHYNEMLFPKYVQIETISFAERNIDASRPIDLERLKASLWSWTKSVEPTVRRLF